MGSAACDPPSSEPWQPRELPDDLPYEDWVRSVLDHPVTEPIGFLDDGQPSWNEEADPRRTVAYLGRFFRSANDHASGYTEGQIAQSLWYLVSNSRSNYAYALVNPDVPLKERTAAIRAISGVYSDLFVRRCAPALSHVGKPPSNPLNAICYMWWDVFHVWWGAPVAESATTMDACLRVLETALALPHSACQESALHGLGHRPDDARVQAEQLIDAYLARERDLDGRLRSYALAARTGGVL